MPKKTRVERTRAGGLWTEARFFSFLRSALRKASSRWPVKYHVKDQARRNKPKGKAGRHKFEYQCAYCTKWYAEKDIAIDHIVPAGSLKSFQDLPEFAERLFCEADGLQVLCSKCHAVKTNSEREERKNAKQA